MNVSPSLNNQKVILETMLEELRCEYYATGLGIVIAEAQYVPPSNKKEGDSAVARLKLKQNNAARAIERLQGELRTVEELLSAARAVMSAEPDNAAANTTG